MRKAFLIKRFSETQLPFKNPPESTTATKDMIVANEVMKGSNETTLITYFIHVTTGPKISSW